MTTRNSPYSADSELARSINADLGWQPNMMALEAMRRRGKVYVRGTALKPDEARELARHCESRGYVYGGPHAD